VNPQISIPILIAAVAFVAFEGSSKVIEEFLFREMRWHNKESIRERLAQIGKISEDDYGNFRLAQMSLLTIELILIVTLFSFNVIKLPGAVILIGITWFATVALTERNLTQRCIKRRAEIEDEFPAIVEILTLAIGAGESPAAAFKRIASRGNGYLAAEFRIVVREIEGGASFSAALDSMSKRLQSGTLRRFADSILISISRGTPLVETLLNGTSQSRNLERVRLLSAAGKSEVSMMIPVVFLILPISILFALFPSLSTLNLFSS